MAKDISFPLVRFTFRFQKQKTRTYWKCLKYIMNCLHFPIFFKIFDLQIALIPIHLQWDIQKAQRYIGIMIKQLRQNAKRLAIPTVSVWHFIIEQIWHCVNYQRQIIWSFGGFWGLGYAVLAIFIADIVTDKQQVSRLC